MRCYRCGIETGLQHFGENEIYPICFSCPPKGEKDDYEKVCEDLGVDPQKVEEFLAERLEKWA